LGVRTFYFRLKTGGKNYNFDFFLLGVTCEKKLFVECPQEGISQQNAVAKYVSEAIPKLAAGVFGSQPNNL